MKKNNLFILAICLVLTIAFLTPCINLANEITTIKNEQFKKPENEIIGKITAITQKSVTVEIAERKKPDELNSINNKNEKPLQNLSEKPDKETIDNTKKDPQFDKSKINKNLDDFFTLTGTKTTIDITNATFNEKPKNITSDKNINNNIDENINKTYKDYSIGDYIMIELTDNNSNVAKSIRDANDRHREKKDRFEEKNQNIK